MIPKYINLIYKTNNLPDIYRPYYDELKKKSIDWKINFFTDISAQSIMKRYLPQYYKTYLNYSYDIQRADFFRIAIIYLIGGFYLDLDMILLKKLDDLCSNNIVLGQERFISMDEDKNCLNRQRIANYMFGSIPRHSFWINCMDNMTKNSSKKINREEDILETTGPGMLTHTYHEYKNHYNDINVLITNKKCLKWCEKESCHFGEYAAHMHLGTWRW